MSLALPIIDRPLDNTALEQYMACPAKYQMAMVQHRRKRGGPPPALAYGTAWHAVMETHYKTGGDEWAAKNAGAEAWVQHSKPDDHRTLPRLLLEYDRYRERWGAHPELEGAQTVGFPESPVIEQTVNAIWPGALHPYAGKIDRLIELNGQIYVEDHKTASRRDDYFFSQFELDNQMLGYAWLAWQLTGRWIAGVRINAHFIRKKEYPAHETFEREIVPFSAARLNDWAENYNPWVRRIEESYTTNVWPRNFKACVTKYGMCPTRAFASSTRRSASALSKTSLTSRSGTPSP
jgi:hypothetical protein